MTFSPETLTLLVLVSLGLAGLALFLLTAVSTRHRGRLEPAPMEGRDEAMDEQSRAIEGLRGKVRQLTETDAALREELARTIQRVGVVRFDAFDDMGGRLSFSLALLDAAGDGVVVTSINGRQDTRVYAKPVTRGSSTHNLSEEEAEAIRQAMAASVSA